MSSRKAVFLDRDGVLNRVTVQDDGKPHPPANLDELEILDGVKDACTALRDAGFLLIVVTNQPDVARGTQRREIVQALNDALRHLVPVDAIQVCYHDDADECSCRKPRPGMLLEAAHTWRIDLTQSVMVGDRWSDIEAGRQAGCKTVLIEKSYSCLERCVPDFRTTSLPDAVDWILTRGSRLVRKGG